MVQLFWLQIFTSFLIGGGIIALLSYLSEIAPANIKGLIMPFPSTILVSLFFIAQINGVPDLVSAIPGMGYAFIGSMVYILSYLLMAQLMSGFVFSIYLKIFLTWFFSSIFWVIFPILAQWLPREDLFIPFGSLIVCIFLFQPLFIVLSRRYSVEVQLKPINVQEMIFRFVFAGTIIAFAVCVSKFSGSFWGAVIGATYPAAFGSQLMIFQKKYPAGFIAVVLKMAPFGIFSLIAYSFSVYFFYAWMGIWWGTLASLVVSLATAFIVSKVSARVVR